MAFTIVGLRENGNMAIHDRGIPTLPTEGALEAICRDFGFTQIMVTEDRFAGYAKRYVYDLEPRLREASM